MTKTVSNFLYKTAIHLGPWFVALAPAIVSGVNISKSTESMLGKWSVVAGISAALGFEIAGITGFHTALDYFSRGATYRGAAAFFGGLLYVTVGIGTTLLVEDASNVYKVIGTAIFLLVPLVYTFAGMNADIERMDTEVADAKQDAIATERRTFEQDQERLDRQTERSIRKKKAFAEIAESTGGNSVTSERKNGPSREQKSEKVYVSPGVQKILEVATPNEVYSVTDLMELSGMGKTVAYDATKTPHFEKVGHGQFKYINGAG